MMASAAAVAAQLPIEKRKHRRRKVWLPAVVRTDAQELPAWIRDVSCKGAMLELDEPCAIDSKIVLLRKQIETVATVAWVHGRLMGLLFETPFTEKDLIEYCLPRARLKLLQQMHGRRGPGRNRSIRS
jgi:hypothetical protein